MNITKRWLKLIRGQGVKFSDRLSSRWGWIACVLVIMAVLRIVEYEWYWEAVVYGLLVLSGLHLIYVHWQLRRRLSVSEQQVVKEVPEYEQRRYLEWRLQMLTHDGKIHQMVDPHNHQRSVDVMMRMDFSYGITYDVSFTKEEYYGEDDMRAVYRVVRTLYSFTPRRDRVVKTIRCGYHKQAEKIAWDDTYLFEGAFLAKNIIDQLDEIELALTWPKSVSV